MKNTLLQHHKSDGFTLIEVLIALAVSGIILTSVFMAFKSQNDSYLAQDQVVEMQENIRAAVGLMVQELRMAGYDPNSSGNVGIEEAGDQSVYFTLIANGGTQDVRFSFNNDGSITRADGNSDDVIAENIEALEFNYLDDEGNIPRKTKSDGTQVLDLDKIANIEISVLARSGQPDKTFTHNRSYTTASGATWGGYTDNFRRRFQIITVNLRNKDI